MIEIVTAGESHGKGLMVIIRGIPAGIEVDFNYMNEKMLRRQGGYGRGGRMKIEKDKIEVISGIRHSKTLGSPVGFLIKNKDWENWQEIMAVDKDVKNSQLKNNIEKENKVKIKKDGRIKEVECRVSRPRPGHADLSGVLKYKHSDIRNVLERASARETAARVAAGGLLDCLLEYFEIDIISHVVQLGDIKTEFVNKNDFNKLKNKVFKSKMGCINKEIEKEMIKLVDKVKKSGDSLGGVVEIRTTPLVVGLGTYTDWKERLDGRLAQALMSIPAVKGVEIGPAFNNSGYKGSEVHDEIFYNDDRGFYHRTNRAGGLEGGMSNGEPLIVRMAVKPIPTLYKPLQSVDIDTKESFEAGVERSDVTAITAAGVVGEAMVAAVLAEAVLEKFGGDSIEDILENYKNYLRRIKMF